MSTATLIQLGCNIHAASFVKGEHDEEYDDVEDLIPAVGLVGEFSFTYDYPLRNPATFLHKLTPDMTGEDLLVLARGDYERIYKEEEAAAGTPGHIIGMLNRAESHGPYGIWGHDFDNLFFEGINIDIENQTIEFSMGS